MALLNDAGIDCEGDAGLRITVGRREDLDWLRQAAAGPSEQERVEVDAGGLVRWRTKGEARLEDRRGRDNGVKMLADALRGEDGSRRCEKQDFLEHLRDGERSRYGGFVVIGHAGCLQNGDGDDVRARWCRR